jgi:hypothetical protein
MLNSMLKIFVGPVMEGGCTPSCRWGSGGCAPGKIFKFQMHVGEFSRIFQTKIITLTPVFMPVDFGKVPHPFDF